MSKPVKISTVLTRAAKHIEKHGLAKGAYFKYRNGRPVSRVTTFEEVEIAVEKGCKACTWGSLYVGAYSPNVTLTEFDDLTSQAARYLDGATWGIASWNDRPERTQDEVVQALKDAAKAARKDGK